MDISAIFWYSLEFLTDFSSIFQFFQAVFGDLLWNYFLSCCYPLDYRDFMKFKTKFILKSTFKAASKVSFIIQTPQITPPNPPKPPHNPNIESVPNQQNPQHHNQHQSTYFSVPHSITTVCSFFSRQFVKTRERKVSKMSQSNYRSSPICLSNCPLSSHTIRLIIFSLFFIFTQ